MADIGIAGIAASQPVRPAIDDMRAWLATLEKAIAQGERDALYRVLREAVPDFRGEAA